MKISDITITRVRVRKAAEALFIVTALVLLIIPKFRKETISYFHKFITCKMRGHRSTGRLLTGMCDRCFSWFDVKRTVYEGDEKISTSR